MDVVSLVILLIVGVLAGGVGGLLGIGGCILMMPVIRFGFDFSPALAVGTTLTAVVFTAAAGTYKHWKLGNIDWGAIKYIAPAGVIGVIVGSIIFYFISGYGEVIDLIIGLAFLPAAVRMLYEGIIQKKRPDVAGNKINGSTGTKVGLGAGVGILTGVIGLGGGYALVPSFIYIARSPMRIAIGSSMASFVWFALVGAAIKIFQGFTDFPSALALGIGAAGGAIIGAGLVSKFKPAMLKAMFGFIFVYVSLKYILLFFGIQI